MIAAIVNYFEIEEVIGGCLGSRTSRIGLFYSHLRVGSVGFFVFSLLSVPRGKLGWYVKPI